MPDSANVLEFVIDGQRYAVEIGNVSQGIFLEDALEGQNVTSEDAFGSLGAATDALNESPDLTQLPYSPSYLLGLLPFRGDSIEVVDPKAMFGLDNSAETQALDEELQDAFESIEAVVNEHIQGGGISEEAASDMQDEFQNLRGLVLQQHGVELESFTGKELLVLTSELSETERNVGLLVDEIRDVVTVGPDELNTSSEREGVIGTIEREGEDVIVWLDPRPAISGEELTAAA